MSKLFGVLGPGFSGEYDAIEDAQEVIDTNKCGAIYLRLDLSGGEMTENYEELKKQKERIQQAQFEGQLEIIAAQIEQLTEIARTEVRIEFHEKQAQYERERLVNLKEQLKRLGWKDE
ncbi:MAG: hypothetical protein AB1631_31640 [Acidobacteriota bacterium]